MPADRSIKLIAAAAGVALIVAVVVVLSLPSHHGTGTNGSPMSTFKPLPAGGQLCQQGEWIERGTGRIRFRQYDGNVRGPFEVRVSRATDEATPIATGRATADGEYVIAPIDRQPRGTYDATVCIRNTGPTDTSLYGQDVGRADSATTEPGALPPEPWVRIRLDYSEAGKRSWWSLAPDVAKRFALVKASFVGPWTLWVVLAALLAVAFGSIWYMARSVSR
jgi:hypothetical protein